MRVVGARLFEAGPGPRSGAGAAPGAVAVAAIGVLSRAAYGLAFAVALPVALVAWARATEAVIRLPAVHAPVAGAVLTAAGALLVAAGAHALITRGHGLPMNAFPPARLVHDGVYGYLRNPMYVGFGLACAGVSIAGGSASGFWLVSPAAALSAGALV